MKIVFYLMTLLLSILWSPLFSLAQSTSESPQVVANMFNSMSFFHCPNWEAIAHNTCGNLSGTLTLYWSKTPRTNQWANQDFVNGPSFSGVYNYSFNHSNYQGSEILYGELDGDSGHGTCASCNSFPSPDAVGWAESLFKNVSVCDYFTPTGGSRMLVCSNAAVVSNPCDAPIGSQCTVPVPSPGPSTYPGTILVPSDKISQTNDPINIATGEDYFSSKDFSLSTQGRK